MVLSRKRYRRILLLTGLLILISTVYYMISRNVIKIDPLLIKITGLFFTLVLSLLIASIIIKLTGNKVWNMFEKEMEVEQRIIISKLYSVSLYTLAFIITFWKAGVSLGDFTIFAGLIATGFAFAVRDLLLSFFAWFIILNKKPFQLGDYIRVGEDNGLVTRIGTFFFTLEQYHPEEYHKIPNSLVLSKPVQNLGSGKFREEIRIRLAAIPEHIQEILIELIGFIKSRNTFKDNIKCQLGADDNGWFILVSFYTSFKQENLKPAILMKIQGLLADYIKINNGTIQK
jgi:MscS family membrane protein